MIFTVLQFYILLYDAIKISMYSSTVLTFILITDSFSYDCVVNNEYQHTVA